MRKDFVRGRTHLGLDTGYFGNLTLQSSLAAPQSNRCLTTQCGQQWAAPSLPLSLCVNQLLRVSVSSSHSQTSV